MGLIPTPITFRAPGLKSLASRCLKYPAEGRRRMFSWACSLQLISWSVTNLQEKEREIVLDGNISMIRILDKDIGQGYWNITSYTRHSHPRLNTYLCWRGHSMEHFSYSGLWVNDIIPLWGPRRQTTPEGCCTDNPVLGCLTYIVQTGKRVHLPQYRAHGEPQLWGVVTCPKRFRMCRLERSRNS